MTDSSTTHALVTLVHHLLHRTAGTGKSVRVFLVDLSKAFGRIDSKIGQYGSTDVVKILDWKFLTNRKQRFKLNGCVSDWALLRRYMCPMVQCYSHCLYISRTK